MEQQDWNDAPPNRWPGLEAGEPPSLADAAIPIRVKAAHLKQAPSSEIAAAKRLFWSSVMVGAAHNKHHHRALVQRSFTHTEKTVRLW